jgi:hypothetical protein
MHRGQPDTDIVVLTASYYNSPLAFNRKKPMEEVFWELMPNEAEKILPPPS